MNFSEKTQTFLVASYYKHLKERFGERGRNAFLHGVKHYAMQRGNRMAQRAIRAGEPLDYGAFCRYGEWVPSEEAVLSGTASVSEVTAVSPDYEYHVTACPWFLGFREADAMEAGALYCGCLDEAMLRGFHEAIEFHTVQTMHDANSHFPRPAGPHFPARQGHIKRPVLESGTGVQGREGLHPASL